MVLSFYQDAKKEWRWRVKADNGRIVGDGGEGYKRLADAVNGALICRIGITNYLQGLQADESALPTPEK